MPVPGVRNNYISTTEEMFRRHHTGHTSVGNVQIGSKVFGTRLDEVSQHGNSELAGALTGAGPVKIHPSARLCLQPVTPRLHHTDWTEHSRISHEGQARVVHGLG